MKKENAEAVEFFERGVHAYLIKGVNPQPQRYREFTVDGWLSWYLAKLLPNQPVFESSVVIKSMLF
jgi:hypothetical protein